MPGQVLVLERAPAPPGGCWCWSSRSWCWCPWGRRRSGAGRSRHSGKDIEPQHRNKLELVFLVFTMFVVVILSAGTAIRLMPGYGKIISLTA